MTLIILVMCFKYSVSRRWSIFPVLFYRFCKKGREKLKEHVSDFQCSASQTNCSRLPLRYCKIKIWNKRTWCQLGLLHVFVEWWALNRGVTLNHGYHVHRSFLTQKLHYNSNKNITNSYTTLCNINFVTVYLIIWCQ